MVKFLPDSHQEKYYKAMDEYSEAVKKIDEATKNSQVL
jgi:hypothetical protein